MKIIGSLRPSLILSETHFPFLGISGAIADAVDRIAGDGFYTRIEIATIDNGRERRRIGRIISQHDLEVTQWMSVILSQEHLNLSSVDEELRRRSVQRIKALIVPALECGTTRLGVNSGPDPGPELRQDARHQLVLSLCELCDTLQSCKPLICLLEPLDRGAHKNGLIGPMPEAVKLAQTVRSLGFELKLCWDSGHVALNGEDLFETLRMSNPFIDQLHFSNVVLEQSCTAFGDHHIPIGLPGFLDIPKIAEVLRNIEATHCFESSQPSVAVEVRTPKDGDPWETERHCRTVIQKAWKVDRSMIDKEP